MKTINIARDFAVPPGDTTMYCHRLRTDGEFSAEQLRDDILLPALEEGPVTVELDDAGEYSQGFLEECFGGLVKSHDFPLGTLRQYLHIATKDDELFWRIAGIIRDAEKVEEQIIIQGLRMLWA